MGRVPKGMGVAQCKICQRDDLDEIHTELAKGVSCRSISLRLGIANDKLAHHWRSHVTTDKYEQGLLVIGIHDIMNIPADMKERREMQIALIDRICEPFGDGRPAALKRTNVSLLLSVWKLMMQDEDRVLRVVGLLKDDGDNAALNVVSSQQVMEMRDKIEAHLRELAQGDGLRAARARAALSNALFPRPGLPMGEPTQVDLDPTEWEELNRE